jgi:hypothetical protein
MSGRGIGDIQYERHARASLQRVPLIDLAVQVEVHCLPHFLWKDFKYVGLFNTRIDGSDLRIFVVGVDFIAGSFA